MGGALKGSLSGDFGDGFFKVTDPLDISSKYDPAGLRDKGVPTVNAAGSALSDDDKRLLAAGTSSSDPFALRAGIKNMDPARQAKMFLNWLTAGGAPKPTDPGQIFTDAQNNAPAAQAAARGAGVGGLFGTGSMIGELAPAPEPIKPIQGLKPLNFSPLQPGVPYSVPALPKVGGK